MGEPKQGVVIRIVTVDDQLLVREGLRRVFDAVPDFDLVGECADGDEIVDVVTSLRPDLVLMDMRMKRVNGAAAIEQLSRLESRPPVLVLTTYDDPETLASALQAGAEGFLLKESVGLDLVRAIRTVAGGGAWLDPAVSTAVLAVYRDSQLSTARPIDAVGLTEREVEVLRLMALGRTNPEIADTLYISERTVKTHIGHVFAKLGVRDRVGAVLRAHELGVVDRHDRSER
jgi:DNA-binding NarL/FixJ family response regulator